MSARADMVLGKAPVQATPETKQRRAGPVGDMAEQEVRVQTALPAAQRMARSHSPPILAAEEERASLAKLVRAVVEQFDW